MYDNNYNNNGGGYNRGGYYKKGGSGYNRGSGGYNNNGGGNGGRQRKKRSGCKWTTDKEGNRYLSAWNASKEKGMIDVFVFPYHGTKDVSSTTSRKTYKLMMARITYKSTGNILLRPVLVEKNTGRTVIKDLGWVLNPSAPNGGYCGTFTRKNR